MLILIITIIAMMSQNLIPVHIAFIPILIPPLLHLMNKLKIDRRAVACALAFGLKTPYIAIPAGFGLIFQGLIADNLTQNGMQIAVGDIWKSNWFLALAMLTGLLIAVFVTYRKPREYKDIQISEDTAIQDEEQSHQIHKKPLSDTCCSICHPWRAAVDKLASVRGACRAGSDFWYRCN